MKGALRGVGRFSWPAAERRSDRYGLVGLLAGDDGTSEWMGLVTAGLVGKAGRLFAVVLETQESRHIGDMFRGIYPATPAVGDEIVLGEGVLFVDTERVGLEPSDGRESDWLNPHQLYRAIDQKVELLFEEVP